jgi:predicted RNase H-like HicB family nuclease
MYKYNINIHWEEEEELFVAIVPELPGCMSHGYTPEETVKNIMKAIKAWIDTAKELGREIPEPALQEYSNIIK